MSHSSSHSPVPTSSSPGGSVHPPRKRKVSPIKNGISQKKKQKLTNHSNQNQQPVIKDHFSTVEMAHQVPKRSLSAPASETETNNHKMSLNNHSKGSPNNHARKPGQGKKLVIKNLRGNTFHSLLLAF